MVIKDFHFYSQVVGWSDFNI